MSMFKYNYVEVQEKENAPLVEGDASFKIIGTYDKTKEGVPLVDKAGNGKLNVSLSVTDKANNSGVLYEMFTVNTGWKVKAILEAIGLGQLYDKSGALNPNDIIGGMGKCTLKMQEASGAYPAKIVIDKFIKAPKQAVIKQDYSLTPGFEDEEIPF